MSQMKKKKINRNDLEMQTSEIKFLDYIQFILFDENK